MATQITNYGPFTTRTRVILYNGRKVQATLKVGTLPSGTRYTRTTYMVEMAGTFGGPFTKRGIRAMAAK